MMSPRIAPKALVAAAAMLGAGSTALHAQTTWAGSLATGTYTWSDTANWTGGSVPDTNTESADLRRDWTGAPTFQIATNTTINGIYWDDTGSASDVSGTFGATAGAALTLGGTTPFVNVAGGTFTISCPISGNFTKQGSGTLVLSSGTLPTSIAISAGTLAYNRAATNFTLAQALSGAGAFAKRGTGTMTLSGTGNATLANVTGGITMGNGHGIIRVGAQGVLGTNTVNIEKTNSEALGTNTFVEFATTGSATFANNFNFSSATALEAGGTGHIRNTSGSNTLSGTLTLTATGGNGINLESSGTAAGDLLTVSGNIAMGAAPTAIRILSLGGDGNGAVTGVISNGANGTHQVAKTGAGKWTLSGANTHTGGVKLVAGTLAVGNAGAFGAAASSLTLNGGTITSSSATAHTLTAAGDSTIGGDITFGDGTNTGALTLANAFALGSATRTLTVASGTTATLSGVISAGGLTKAGAGTLVLSGSGANTYAGTFTLTAGTLAVGKASALGAAGVSLALNGGTLASSSTAAHVLTAAGASTIGGNVTLGNATNTGALTLANAFDLGAAARTLTVNSAVTLSGAISNGSLVKEGAGTLILSGANSLGGGIAVNAGVLLASSASALPGYNVSGRNSVASGARLQLHSAWTEAETDAAAANTTWSSAGSVLGIDTGADTRTLSTAGAFSLHKSGAGTLVLASANTGSGLEIAAGTFRLGGGSLGSSSTVTSSGSATLDLNGSALTLGKLAFATSSASSLAVVGNAALTVSGSTTAANLQVGPNGSTTNVASGMSSSLDLSGLSSFTYANSAASGGVFRVGPSGANTGGLGQVGYAKLSPSNTITVNLFAIGDQALSNDGGISTLELGAANVINADTVNFGYSNRSDVTVGFASGLSSPTLRLRGRDGTSALGSLLIGNVSQFGGASQTSFTAAVDLSPGVLDANVTTVWVGSADIGTGTNRVGTQVANLTLGAGTLQAGTVVVGRSAATTGTGTGTAQGTVTLNHASGTVNADTLTLADNALAATSVSGTFNLVAGTLRAGAIQRGATVGASSSATLNWTSGTVGNRSGSDLTIGSGLAINLLSGSHVFDAVGSANGITVNSVLAGVSGLTKAGDGTLTLAAANTYSGVTTVSAGTLALGAGGSLAAGALVDLGAGARVSTAAGASWSGAVLRVGGASAVASALLGNFELAGGTLAFDIATASSFDQLALSAGATLTLSSGVLSFNPVSGTYANGDYDIIDHSAGTLAGDLSLLTTSGLVAGTSRQNTSLSNTGTHIRLSVQGDAASLTWTGGASNAWRVHDPVSPLPNWSAGGSVSPGTLADEFYDADSVAFAGAAAGEISVDSALIPGAVAISGSSDYSFVGSGSVSAASLSKSGSGKSTFAVALSTVGGATVSAGELELSAAGSNATAVAVSGGTLRLSGSAEVGAVTLSSGTVVIGASASPASLAATGGTVALGGVSSLGSGTVDLASARLELSGSGAFDKAIAGFANSTFAVTAAGAAVTRSSALLPASGAVTLEVTEADGLFTLSAARAASTAALTKTGAGTVRLTAANTLGSVAVSAGTLQLGDGSSAGSVSSAVTVDSGARLRFRAPSTTSAVNQASGAVSGAGSLEFVGNNTGAGTGTGIYALAAANSHTGGTSVAGARLNLTHASALGSGSVEVGAGGQIFYQVAATPLANTVRLVASATWGDAGTVGNFGGIRMNANVSMSGAIVLAASGARISGSGSTFSGVISEEGGSRGLEINNPSFALGTVTLSGANTFSGPVTVNRNTLSVASLNRVIGGSASSNLGAPVTAEGGVINVGSAASGADLTYTGAGETTDRVVNLSAGTGNSTINANGSGLLRFTSGFTSGAGANRSLVLAGTGAGQIDGALAGASGFTLALTKSGAGSWTLGGANVLAGGVTVSAGSLELTGNNAVSTLTQSGTSTVTTLSGANTFTGAVALGSFGNAGGTLVLASDNALQGVTNLGVANSVLRSSDATARVVAAPISYNDHATFGSSGTGDLLLTGNVNLGSAAKNIVVANAVTEMSGVLSRSSGTANTVKQGAGKLILSGANTYTGTLVVEAGEVELAGAGKLGAASAGLTLSGGQVDLGGTTQSIGAVSVTAAAASGDTLANGTIAGTSYAVSNASGSVVISANLGTGALTKTGAGELVLSGSNSLTGITVGNSGGVVRVTSLAALGSGTLSVSAKNTANSGTIELALSGANTIANAFANFSSANSPVAATPGSAHIRSSGGANTLASALNLTSTGGSGINLESAGTAAGDRLVIAGNVTSSVTSADSSSVRVLSLYGAGDGEVAGSVTNTTNLNVSVLKAGTGAWTLSGSNSHKGVTSVTNGTLVVAGSAALGTTASGTDVSSGSTLALSGSLAIGAEALTLRGSGYAGAGALRSSGGHSTYGGAVSLAAASDVHVADHSLELTGLVSGANALTKAGSGTLILSAANTFSGGVTVSAGTLRLGHASGLGSGAVTVASGATLDVNGLSFANNLTLLAGGILTGGTVAASSGTLDFTGGAPATDVPLALSGTGTIAFGNTAFAGEIAYSGGTVTGAGFTGQLVVSTQDVILGSAIGSGTVRLAAGGSATIAAGFARDIRFEGGQLSGLDAAGYSGAVTVAGNSTLDIDGAGDIARTDAAITVESGSTLKGSGAFGGAVSVAGNLAPGNSPGLMTYESGLSLGSGSVLEWEFDPAAFAIVSDQAGLDAARGSGYDAIDVTGGALSIADGAQLSILPLPGNDYSGTFWDSPWYFSVATLSGGSAISGSLVFDNLTNEFTVTDEGIWQIQHSVGGVTLEWTPVPEPSAYGLALGALALAAAALRRRKGSGPAAGGGNNAGA